MARKTELQGAILDLIAAHADGLARPEIERGLPEPVPTRTLIRWLKELETSGAIVARGVGKATRYHATAGGQERPSGPGEASHPPERGLPVGPTGARLRRRVRKPLLQRAWVTYDREWLAGYEPGKTWYLPLSLRSKLHQRGRTPDPERPAGTFARDIFERLLIDLAWASSRLEGSTYSRLDTQNLLQFGIQAEGKAAEEAQMILNHKKAIEFLVEDAEDVGFNLGTLSTVHAFLSENLIGDPQEEGRVRRRPVSIGGTAYEPPAVPQMIEGCCREILDKAAQIPDPFEQAFFAMVHLPYLQPFVDVNKRTSRLMANLPLIRANLCPLSFVDVPERDYVEGLLAVYEFRRYELLRDVFEWGYLRSCEQYIVVRESLGGPDPIRLKYHREIERAVKEVVQAVEPPSPHVLQHWASVAGVDQDDIVAFATAAVEKLVSLHSAIVRRYGLRNSEYEVWRTTFPPPE